MSGSISRKAAAAFALSTALIAGGVSAVSPAVASSEDNVVYAAGTNWQKVWNKQLKPRADRRYYTKRKTNKKFATKSDLRLQIGALASNTYTKAQVDTGLGNVYTKAEIDGKLAPFANSVASFSGGQQTVTLAPAEKVVRSVSLLPPANGTVVVSSNAWILNTGAGFTAARCSLTTGVVIDENFRQLARVSVTGDSEAIAGTRGFPVTKGNLLTVNLTCETFIGTGDLWDSSMTAIFAPS